jgi:hypothetical protein
MVPVRLLEVPYRRVRPFVHAFDGTQFNLLDLGVWCYCQGVMDGAQMAERKRDNWDFQI